MRLPRAPTALRRPARWGALLAGALPLLAFPAPNLSVLAWFGLVPGLLLISRSPSGREAAVRGWWLGCGYFVAAMWWLAPEIGPAVLIVAVVFGVLMAPFGAVAWRLLRPPVSVRRALAALVVVPSFWLVTEWIRSWQALGGPWAVLGASQWQHPAVLALAAVGGVWLITFALVASNTGLLIALVATRPVVRLAGLAGALVAIAAGPIAFALAAPVPAGEPLTIALIQPGLTSGPAVRLERNERLTQALAGRADLVVWGESSVGYDLPDHPALLTSIEHLSKKVGAEILVDQDAQNAAGAQSKQATLISSAGIQGSYVKTRLVPFGEYIPFRPVLGWLTHISRAAPRNVVPGIGARDLDATLPGGGRLRFGVLICFESAFPDMSRVDTDRGARLIIYQTSDSTFQRSWAPAQHAALSALRAAETGRPVVQAALTGDSVAFDPRGRVLAWAGTSYSGSLVVHLELPPASYRTLFDRFGDFVPWIAVAIAALAALTGLAGIARSRRKPSRGAADAAAEVFTDSRSTG
jgi:apolipoprotein N-acyltransferase